MLVSSTNEVFEQLNIKKDPFNQIIRQWPPKRAFINLLVKYLGMNTGLGNKEIFEDFYDVVTEEMCENVLIKSGSTGYELPMASVIFKFHLKGSPH